MKTETGDSNRARRLDEVNRMFREVWKRVSTSGGDSPLVWREGIEGADETKSTPAAPSMPERGAALALPLAHGAGGHIGDFGAPGTALPFLGQESLVFEPLLHEMIRGELAARQIYRHLGRQVGGQEAKNFGLMASENMQSAKRLSAALFLMTGLRYLPELREKISLGSYLEALRVRFMAEQQRAFHYGAAAVECTDEALFPLFLELAEEKLAQAHRIRQIVERY